MIRAGLLPIIFEYFKVGKAQCLNVYNNHSFFIRKINESRYNIRN